MGATLLLPPLLDKLNDELDAPSDLDCRDVDTVGDGIAAVDKTGPIVCVF